MGISGQVCNPKKEVLINVSAAVAPAYASPRERVSSFGLVIHWSKAVESDHGEETQLPRQRPSWFSEWESELTLHLPCERKRGPKRVRRERLKQRLYYYCESSWNSSFLPMEFQCSSHGNGGPDPITVDCPAGEYEHHCPLE